MYEAKFPLCVVCNKDVNFRQHALCCDICQRWQHRLCGSGITNKDYRCLALGEIEIAWQCSDCSNNSSYALTKDHFRRSNRGVKLRKDPDFLYENESFNPQSNTNYNRVELSDLPSGWEVKPKRKCIGPTELEDMNYIRIFHSKQEALEFCNLHYQEIPHQSIEHQDEIFRPIPESPNENKSDSKYTLTESSDKSLQPFIRLHKLNSNCDNIRIYQPFVQLQRLSPYEISRHTRHEKPNAELSENSESSNINLANKETVIENDLAVKETIINSNISNINNPKIPFNDDNNNKISKIKKKQSKIPKQVKKHLKNNIKNYEIKEDKCPMKVKALLKKDYLKINIKIDRKSLQIHPNHNLWIDQDQDQSESRLNLSLGSVKIQNDDVLESNNILDSAESSDDSAGKQFNQPHRMKLSAENAMPSDSHGSRLIWLHISPKDLDFGLIS